MQARTAKGWSRPQLAEAAGIPYPTLAGLENGDQKTSTAIPALAMALGVNALWLAEGRGAMKLASSSTRTIPSTSDTSSTPSQSASLDPDSLHEALMLLVHDEATGGPYAPRAKSARLIELYERVKADGGRLSAQNNAAFEGEVRAREKVRGGVSGGAKR